MLAALLALAASSPALAEEGEPPAEVRIPLQQYQALLDQARLESGPQVTWSTGSADITLPSDEAGFVTIEARGQLATASDHTSEAILLPGYVVIESIQIDGSEATVVQRSGAYVALLTGEAQHAVVLRYQVARQPSADGELALVPLPPFAGTRVTVTGASSSVDVWPSGNVLSPAPNLSVQIPATPAAVVRWGSGSDLVRRVDYTITIDPGSDGATVEARIEVDLDGARGSVPLAPSTIALTEVQEANKSLPTRVAGAWHRATVRGAGRHVIIATMRVAIDRSEGQPQITMALPPAPIIHVEARVPGNRSVELQPAVPVALTVVGDGDTAVTTAIANLPPSDQMVVSWTEPRTAPETVVSINTETYQLVRIEEGVIRSKVEIRYEIIRGALKELAIQLPDAAVLYKVTGEGIEDWRTFAATETEPRQARIFLGAEREGSYTLELELEQVAPQTVGQKVDIPTVRPLGVAREMGVVALFDGDKVGFAEATAVGYVRSGEDALPIELRQKLGGDIISQAFKHIGAPGPVSSAVAAAKTRETRLDAHVSSLYTFQQNALTVTNSIDIDVKSGRTDRIVLSLPANVKVGTEISAPNLKKADWVDGQPDGQPRKDFEILLTRALEHAIHIELPFEVILGSDLAKLDLPEVRVQGADVKKGEIGITTDPGIEVEQGTLTGLRKLDLAELPNAIKLRARRGVQLGYSYSYVDEPWKLELEVRRHRAVESLTAAVTQAWIETTIFEEGQIVSNALFRVKSEEQQHLRVKVPKDARILGIAVNGERTEANADESGALKIDIRPASESYVEIAYMVRRDPLGLLASVDLEATRPDVFVTDLQWLVRVPEKITVYGTSSELESLPADQYRYPPSAARGHTLGMEVATNTTTTNHLFVAKVLDAGDARALTVSVSTLLAPPALGTLLLVLALALLAFAIWQRARRVSSRLVWAALVAGLLLLVARIAVWGIAGDEAVGLALVLAAVAITSWLLRRREQSAALAAVEPTVEEQA